MAIRNSAVQRMTPDSEELKEIPSTEKKEVWIPLLDYALKNSVSLSTLRRHIKSGKVKSKLDAGKYFILDQSKAPKASVTELSPPKTDATGRLLRPKVPVRAPAPPTATGPSPVVHELEQELQKAQEEIAELRMLVALYEDKLGKI